MYWTYIVIYRFVAVENVQENKTCQNIMKEIVKYGTSSTGELDKLATNHHKTKERYKRRDGKRKSDNQASICSPSMGKLKLDLLTLDTNFFLPPQKHVSSLIHIYLVVCKCLQFGKV